MSAVSDSSDLMVARSSVISIRRSAGCGGECKGVHVLTNYHIYLGRVSKTVSKYKRCYFE